MTVNGFGVLQSVLVKVRVAGSFVAHDGWEIVPVTVTSAVGGASNLTSIVVEWPSAIRSCVGDTLIPASSSSSNLRAAPVPQVEVQILGCATRL